MTESEVKRFCETIKNLIQENRLLGERCNQLLKDKGDLTDQIADIKANCDLAIEGRDVKIKELEEKNTELEKESNRLFLEGAKRVEELEKENAELRNNGFTVSAMTEQQLKVAIEKGEQLEKENAELEAKNKWYSEQVCNKECAEVWGQLTKAIELLKWALHSDPEHDNLADFDTKWKEAEQFIKEIEK